MIVIDASVAIKCVLPEDGSEQATTLVAHEVCTAPDLIVNECVNALWKNARLGRVTAQQAEEAGAIFSALGLQLARSQPLAKRALEMALVLDHPAYDCFYLALAETRMIAMVTTDAKFARKVRASAFNHIAVQLLIETPHEP